MARSANEKAAIETIPAASASIPSIRFTRFASATIQTIVIAAAKIPKSDAPEERQR